MKKKYLEFFDKASLNDSLVSLFVKELTLAVWIQIDRQVQILGNATLSANDVFQDEFCGWVDPLTLF